MDHLYLVVPEVNGGNVTVGAWQDLDQASTSARRTGGVRAWPKCLYGDVNPTDAAPRPGPPPRVTRGPGSDCRAHWPGCVDHVYGDPSMSDDAARWVPDGGEHG